MIKKILFSACVAALALGSENAFAEPLAGGQQQETISVKVSEPGQSATSRTLNIAQNKTAILEFEEDVDDILVANPEIADVLARSKRRIAVLAKGKGESSIIFTNAQGKEILALDVVVAGQGVTELQELINQYVPRAAIKAEFVNGAIVLAGKAPSLSDADMAIQLAQQFVVNDSPVINMVSIEGKDQVLLKVRIVEMQRTVIKQLGVNVSGSMNVGEMANRTLQTAIDPVTGLVALGANGDPLQIFAPDAPWDQSVSFGTSNSLGISGESLGGLRLAPSYNNFVGDKLQSSAGLSVDMLERIGLVRTLAEPNLTALSGESAKFLAGGEFPVPAEVDDDGDVVLEFKPFGVGLGFTPVVLSESRISMRISTEVSELTNQGGYQVGGGVAVNADGSTSTIPATVIPALKVRRADTTVEMPSGGSLVIAGLIQEQTQQAMDKVPGVGNLPVLGSLFRSREFQNDETELVVIVTPYLVDPTDPKKLRSPDDGYVSAKDSKAIFFGKMNKVYAVEGADVEENAGVQGAGFILD
ncbi:type II and III secretion system protein family protein [Hirschia maritima]|uniref:type II and III secretion system protein family protein n=1 Tax=Hirschia maritima TaxID=1121961 RepID=UPI000380B8D3|nr:type II and III secretion system protein family protein [Hirschia maritima]